MTSASGRDDPGHAERRATARAAACFGASTLAAVGLAIVYWRGGDPQVEGVLLAIAFGGIGVGLVTWAKHLLPQGPYDEHRPSLASADDERAAFARDFERGDVAVTRRTILVRLLTLAGAAMAGAALFPLRSLGPRPGKAGLHTSWRDARRAVTADGAPVRAADVPLDGLVTVFPEGEPGSADGQAVLLRVSAERLQPAPGRERWAPDGLVAYSKVCTHAGCPVGLYETDSHTLLCPCHQSSFDVLRAATPTSGPAAWPLPQLPLQVDRDGYVRSTGDFSAPVGPGWWRK